MLFKNVLISTLLDLKLKNTRSENNEDKSNKNLKKAKYLTNKSTSKSIKRYEPIGGKIKQRMQEQKVMKSYISNSIQRNSKF